MASRLDPRAWNLLAGFGLVAGACSGRTIGSDDSTGTGDADTSDDSPDGSTTDSTDPDSSSESESDDSECSQDSECPPGYYCLGGICEYQIAPDGGPWYDCYDIDDCGPLSLCNYGSCEPVSMLPMCRPTGESGIPRMVDDVPLALSYVDVDGQTRVELVVATQTDLHVFESVSVVGTVSPREYESASVTAMVAGDFDPGPGQDLALLVDDTLLIHPSDGVAGFGSPSESSSPQLGSAGMLAGDYDGMPPTDRLVWGSDGASVIAVGEWMLHDAQVKTATAVDMSSGSGRFVLQAWDLMYLYELDGSALADVWTYPFDSDFLVSIAANAQSLDLGANVVETWTLLELRELLSSQGRWGLDGSATAMVGGDLDGDGSDEVALILDGRVTLLDELGSGRACALPLILDNTDDATHLAAGDFDGDGDDDLAVAYASGAIVVFDGEG